MSLLTSYKQFETVILSTVMDALPAALQEEPVSIADLTGAMDFEEDRPTPPHDIASGTHGRGRGETPARFA